MVTINTRLAQSDEGHTGTYRETTPTQGENKIPWIFLGDGYGGVKFDAS